MLLTLLLLSSGILSAPEAAEPWPGWRVRLGDATLEIGSTVAPAPAPAPAPGRPAGQPSVDLTLGGELVTAREIRNGRVLSGVTVDAPLDSAPWAAFWADNTEIHDGARLIRESTGACEEPAIQGGVGCACRVAHMERAGHAFRRSEQRCEGDGDTLIATSLLFGATGPEAERLAEAAREQMNALLYTDQTASAAAAASALREWPATKAARLIERLYAELSLLGKPLPDPGPLQWWQGAPIPLLPDGPPGADPEPLVALLFFESWDPHSPNYLPDAARTLRQTGARIIGVHKGVRNSTDEKIRAVAATFAPEAILRDSGPLSESLNVTGIPAVAILHRGIIIWRGHPNRLSYAPLIAGLAAASRGSPGSAGSASPLAGIDACGRGRPGGSGAAPDTAAAGRALAAIAVLSGMAAEHPQIPCAPAELEARRAAWEDALAAAIRREAPWTDLPALTAWLTGMPEPETIWYALWSAQPPGGKLADAALALSRSAKVEERRAAAAFLIQYDSATFPHFRAALERLVGDPDMLTQRRATYSLRELDLSESTSGDDGE